MKNQKFFFAVVAVLIVLGVFFFFFFVGTPRTFAKGVDVPMAEAVLVADGVSHVDLVEGLATVGDVKSPVILIDGVDVPENVGVAKVVVDGVAVNVGVRDIGVNEATVELVAEGTVLSV